MQIVTTDNQSRKERVVYFNKSDMFGMCSYKLFESYGIPCYHIIQVFRAEKQDEIPLIDIMKRWKKMRKRYIHCLVFIEISYNVLIETYILQRTIFYEEGNILDEKPIDPIEVGRRKKFQILTISLKILCKWPNSLTRLWTFYFQVCATQIILSRRLSLLQEFQNKMNMDHYLVLKFQMTLIYILLMISSRR